MAWNYRVIRHVDKDTKEETFQIHEVFYKNDQPNMITEEGIVPFGETVEELQHSMIHMLQALTKPVLDAKIFENDTNPKKTIDQTLGLLKKNV
tara:strand:- start:277 stop:555 length:279 start_codon:yes stop_codon:yes gene_type:complete